MIDQSAQVFDVIVIGAGAAGIGVGVALQHAGIENFRIVDRHRVGRSFDQWPAETRFITPSYPTNSIGMLDLNSVAIGVSPAYSLEVEHPTGQEYASHLRGVAEFFELPVQENTDVLCIAKVGDEFRIDTACETFRAKHVIWAAGEFQYPRQDGFLGSENCTHTATIASYEDLQGDDFIVIGGYESGVDAAYHLASYDRRVRLFDKASLWDLRESEASAELESSPAHRSSAHPSSSRTSDERSSDPSVSLSTYSLERMREDWFIEQVELFPNTPIASVARVNNQFEVMTLDGRLFRTSSPPLLAGGFDGSHKLVADLFALRADGFPLLNDNDESTVVPGLFLCGPAVRHDSHVFCFIYKYRQRFAVVAKTIANSLGLPAEELETYRKWGMYLDDLSCCGEECVC